VRDSSREEDDTMIEEKRKREREKSEPPISDLLTLLDGKWGIENL
jgi:hypothetical protein